MTTAGLIIVALAGLGIFVIGVLYLVIPRAMAPNFGLPVVPSVQATAWLRLKGIRDLATGVAAGVLLLTAPAAVIGYVVVAVTIIPVGDAVTILRSGGDVRTAWGIHLATAAGMLTGAGLLIAG